MRARAGSPIAAATLETARSESFIGTPRAVLRSCVRQRLLDLIRDALPSPTPKFTFILP